MKPGACSVASKLPFGDLLTSCTCSFATEPDTGAKTRVNFVRSDSMLPGNVGVQRTSCGWTVFIARRARNDESSGTRTTLPSRRKCGGAVAASGA